MWIDLFTGRIANIIAAIVSVILLLFNIQTVDISGSTIDTTQLTPTWYDEFEGNTLSTENWQLHNPEGFRKGGYWDIDQCSVSDGNLIIKTEFKNDRLGEGWYTAGIHGKYDQAYGYFECRCKLPKGQGLWSAFWLTCHGASQVNGSGTQGAEIDVFESPYGYNKGRNSWKVTTNIHYNGYGSQTQSKNVAISSLNNDPYENFNTYGVLWTEDEYVFYINGHEVARTDYGGVSQVKEYPVLSCEVDGAAAVPTDGWSGRIDKNPEGKAFTAEFVVDYVKIYSLEDIKQNKQPPLADTLSDILKAVI